MCGPASGIPVTLSASPNSRSPPVTRRHVPPDGPVIERRWLAFVIRAIGQSTPATIPGRSSLTSRWSMVHTVGRADVPVGYHAGMRAKGIAQAAVTRAEMATFLTRAFGLTPITPVQPPRRGQAPVTRAIPMCASPRRRRSSPAATSHPGTSRSWATIPTTSTRMGTDSVARHE